ncbi:MAG: OsmC family protein [Burkholderiaceae bacterium]|nr:OsmC family protein [Burkholderiaceae bacterium]
MSDAMRFTLTLTQQQDYEFRVRFDGPHVPELLLDEPPPLGRGAGPNAARLLAAAVANCLSASLLFCLRKFRQTPGTLQAEVTGTLRRNARGRSRIGGLDVTIRLAETAQALSHLDRCLGQFEDFCVVTESVRQGIPVAVRVVDASGTEVLGTGATPRGD